MTTITIEKPVKRKEQKVSTTEIWIINKEEMSKEAYVLYKESKSLNE